MSLSNRAASKGGKGTKADKSHKSEKSESGKSSDKQQHRDANSKSEDPSIKDKVKMLIEMTQRSEEEVCYALHECDSDLTQAINMLFESMGTGEWETRVKKKKTRQASASKEKSEENAPVDGWDESAPAGAQQGDKEKPRNRNGPPPRLHRNNDSRGWRGRERQENDRNHNDSGRPDYQRDRDRRGRPGGPRGGGGGRGRGGGRTGGRYPPRGNRSNSYNKPIETWDNSNNTWDNSTALAATNNNPEETWDEFPGTDEWSTEEYQGSLADTKVFTPSVPPSLDAIAEPPGGQVMADPTLANPQIGQTLQMGQNMQMPSQSPVPAMVGALTAAQTQYFSQLQQNNDSLSNQYVPGQTTYEKSTSAQYNSGASIPYNSGAGAQYNANAASQYNSISTSQYSGTPSAQYSSTQQYGGQGNAYADAGYQSGNASYGVPEAVPAQQPPRAKTQRARVPPPSKIPASAVEMPGDLNSSIGYLDVQFGAMDLIDSSSSFDSAIDNKYASQTTTMDLSNVTTASALDHTSPSQNTTLDAYSPKTNTQSSISSALSQSLSNSDSIPQTSEHLASSTYSSVPRSTTQGGGTSTTGVSGSAAAAGGLELTKQPDSHSYTQPSTYNSYQSKANTYNSSSYVATTTTASSYVSNQANSYVNVNNQSGGGGYSAPSGNAYPNAYSSNSSYQSTTNSATFPSISQANTYSSNNQTYPQNTSQSVYGPNAGLSNSTYGNTSTSQYNNYSSNNKIVKDSAYDSSSSATSVSQAAATTNVTSSVPISLSQTTISVSKTSTTLAAKNSNSVVSNIPPGVTPVMSAPYLVGQVPYFHQQHVYSYEDMQLLQQRLPHMTTPYYDMPYPTPTTLAQVRDATLGNVGYSLSDGRFTRTDNNASPVPSTLSQQTSTLTQGHQAQPILAGTAPPYFFATAFNTIAPNYQFGTMYAQMPAATNAHGSNNSTQYPKPATYGSGYGSYDALNQSQDYTKGAYVGNTQAQKAAGANASSTGSAGNDLSAMYAKSHTALGKVNSYEKQGFHSGTPPPFTGALHGSQSAGLAPSGTGYAPQVYIPTMAPHQQHHSTHLMQQPLHQDSGNTGGQRSQTSNQPKTGAKQSYQTSYWNQA